MMMLVYFANDAAYNIAVSISGSQQAFDQMNKRRLPGGMTSTQFQNPSWPDANGHYSTARDLALMGRYAREAVTYRKRCAYQVAYNGRRERRAFHSTDDLMDTYRGLLGIKTGAELWYCLLGRFKAWKPLHLRAWLRTTQGRLTIPPLMNWAYHENYNRVSVSEPTRYADSYSEDNFSLAVVKPSASTYGMAWLKTHLPDLHVSQLSSS